MLLNSVGSQANHKNNPSRHLVALNLCKGCVAQFINLTTRDKIKDAKVSMSLRRYVAIWTCPDFTMHLDCINSLNFIDVLKSSNIY